MKSTAEEVASEHGVSEKTVRNAATFAKDVDTWAGAAGPDMRQGFLYNPAIANDAQLALFMQDVTVWYTRRAEYAETIPDFENAALTWPYLSGYEDHKGHSILVQIGRGPRFWKGQKSSREYDAGWNHWYDV